MKRFFYLTTLFVFMAIYAFGQNGQYSWVTTAGGTSYDYNYNAWTDADGNTYVTGKFKSDPMDLGNGVSISPVNGAYTIYVAKFDANGVAQWARSAGGGVADEGDAVTVDQDGNVYVTGGFFGTAHFSETDSLVSSGNYDIFIAKYDNDGNLVWVKQAGSLSETQDKGTGIVTDADGYVYVAGYFGDRDDNYDVDTLVYDGNQVLTTGGDRDVLVMKIDSDGNFIWGVSAGGYYNDEAHAIDLDEENNVYITGYYGDTTSVFGSTTLPYVDDYEVFVAKLDGNSGDFLWAQAIVGMDYDNASSISASIYGPDNGIALIAGYFNDELTYDAQTLTSYGDDDIFFAAFDKDGSFLGMKQFGGDAEDKAYAVKLVDEDIYIGGYSSSSFVVGEDTVTNYGSKDALLIKYNGPNDEVCWVKNYGGTSYDYVEAIGADANNNVYFTGYIKSNPATFDPLEVTTAGGYDLWVGKMDYTGPTKGVFFSEYIEGSSNNKALEIYNGSGQELNLDNFLIKTGYNGNGWTDVYTFPSGATLADGDVWVIANSDADSTILAVADDIWAYNENGWVVAFNGDDARGLAQIVDGDTVLIDVIGIPDEDPGSGWDVAGVSAATANHTLVRKSSVCEGTTDWYESAGTDADNSQWIVYDEDTFTYLGSHTCGTPTTVNVTFQVDMSVQAAMGNFDPATHTVSIPGAFNGWDTAADMLSDDDGDLVYSVTLTLDPNATYEYKYFAMGQWESIDNRSVTTTDADMILDPVYFNDIDEVPPAGDASVTFEVDMRLPMRQGTMNPGQQVFVAGSFNGWSTSTDEMTDDDGDSTYTVTVPNLQSGEELQFKYIYYKTDGSVEWEGIDNRHFTPVPGDSNYYFAFWNDIDPDVTFADGDITFNVDMSVMSEVGIYDNTVDSMMVRGSFNGWGDQDVMNQDPLAADFYYKTVAFEQQPVGMDIAYKFYVHKNDPNTLWTDGWERPFSQGGGNRNVEFAGETGQQVDPVYFSDVDPDWVVEAGQTVEITFQVDMTDAADPNIQVPTFNPATDTVWWIAEQPAFVYTQGWVDTDNMRVLAMTDDDGDMVYTGTLVVNGPAWNGFEYRYAFTHDGGTFTHEPAGFADFAYRVRYLPMTGARQFVQPYTAPQDHWTPQEDKSDQWEDGPVVGVEDEAGIVKKFDLQQNYPNPFNPTTTIKFSVPKNGLVTLKVYNLLGQEVATLVNEQMNAGSYKVNFDASNLGSGVYFYKLQAGNSSATKKMILLK